MTGLIGNVSGRAFRVWQRNRDVYFVTWKTNLVPPLLEPILYLLAFGAGIGALVKQVTYRGAPIGYTAFIAPGLLATQVMFQSFFENTYNTFVRMVYQRTFDAIVTTPLTLEDIMAGELLWGATKGTIGCTIMMAAISAFGLIHYPQALVIVPFSFLAGLFFAGMALCFTGVVPQIDVFNFPIFLFVMPMFLFSGTFFPLDVLPLWAQRVAMALPLTHVTNIMREACLGRLPADLLYDLLYIVAVTVPVTILGLHLMKKRLVK
ncbi:MAG TPA: ABC transporter permease [Candidatus Polarisedimenticolia bacterium]|nr:ABC transporter permease [Candidatus Polarisedimenticolia bacterium]